MKQGRWKAEQRLRVTDPLGLCNKAHRFTASIFAFHFWVLPPVRMSLPFCLVPLGFDLLFSSALAVLNILVVTFCLTVISGSPVHTASFDFFLMARVGSRCLSHSCGAGLDPSCTSRRLANCLAVGTTTASGSSVDFHCEVKHNGSCRHAVSVVRPRPPTRLSFLSGVRHQRSSYSSPDKYLSVACGRGTTTRPFFLFSTAWTPHSIFGWISDGTPGSINPPSRTLLGSTTALAASPTEKVECGGFYQHGGQAYAGQTQEAPFLHAKGS